MKSLDDSLALGLAGIVPSWACASRSSASSRASGPYKLGQRRCPVCGRAGDFYDMANCGAPRLWRAMDLARSACYLDYGALQGALPGARRAHRGRPLGAATGRASRATSRTRWRGWRSAAPPRRSPSSPASSGTAWAACAGASTPSWRPRAAPRGSTACAASASTRRRTRKGQQNVTVGVDDDRGCLRIWLPMPPGGTRSTCPSTS